MNSMPDAQILNLDNIPNDWDTRAENNPYLQKKCLQILKKSSSVPFRLVYHRDFIATEYDLNLNIFSFARFLPKVFFKIVVVGLPVSVSGQGFCGSFERIKEHYKKQHGLFLILNIEEKGTHQTLPTCVFYNRFTSFDDYLKNLRSPYRRRVNLALNKSKPLTVEKICNDNFDDKLQNLYEQVVSKSDYPLEVQNKDFFRLSGFEIYVFYENATPVAFVALDGAHQVLNFVFGGMDYGKLKNYDLYYNMLVLILKHGINGGFSAIDFGQTAESSKMRLGCVLEKRYLKIIHSSPLINSILQAFSSCFEYKKKFENYRVFNTDSE